MLSEQEIREWKREAEAIRDEKRREWKRLWPHADPHTIHDLEDTIFELTVTIRTLDVVLNGRHAAKLNRANATLADVSAAQNHHA